MDNDLEALAETRQLRVLTNAVENGANPSGCSDYLREKQNILSRGVDVYEVICGQSLHTKTILIGDDLSIVGSFNADMRSAYLDTELMLVIESEEVNAALRQESVQYIDQSRLALHDGGTEYGAQFEEVTLPWTKRALYTILSVVQRYGGRSLLIVVGAFREAGAALCQTQKSARAELAPVTVDVVRTP